MASAKHLNYIDRLKGFAILSMVMGHIYLFCYENHDMVLLKYINTMNMPLFMFLSGLVVSANFGYVKLGRRVLKYIVPSIVVGFVTALMVSGCSSIQELLNMITLHLTIPASGFWYLVVLTIFNISLILHKVNKKNSLIADILTAGVLYSFFLIFWKMGGVFWVYVLYGTLYLLLSILHRRSFNQQASVVL